MTPVVWARIEFSLDLKPCPRAADDSPGLQTTDCSGDAGVIQGVIKDDSGQAVSSVYVAAVNPTIGGKQYTAVIAFL